MSMLPVGIGSAVGGYQIERSLRFNSADDAYVSRTFSTPTNNKKWSYSVWMKRSAFAANQTIMSSNVDGAEYWDMRFNTSDQIFVQNRVGSSNLLLANTTAVYRDPSAWYHIVFVFDSDNATAAFRNRLYVNNVEYTLSANSGSGNASAWNVNSVQHNIGVSRTLTTGGGIWAEFNGYETEINFIDGQALTPSSFGETDTDTGVWKPKAYSGSYGTNGFYLKFADNSGTTSTTLGKDSSGNGNNWTPNNFSVTAGAGNDSLVDTPTPYGTDTGVGGEVRGNYATWNPLNNPSASIFANGNLDASDSSGVKSISTIGISSGKWYWEVTLNALGSQDVEVGIVNSDTIAINNTVGSYGWGVKLSRRWDNGTLTSSSIGTATTGDIVGLALDLTNSTFTVYKNGSQLYQTTGIVSGTFFPAVAVGGTSGSDNVTVNFGQRPFAYTAPSGFKALCTQNLPEPTIKDGGDYFNTVLYTGTGSARSVTGVGFQPDFVWAKGRSNADPNYLHDAVRTVAYRLNSAITDGEYAGLLSSFDSDGFTINSSGGGMNGSGNTYVAWNWKANGAGSSNTAGTITSTVSVNTTSGFSIVTYTGNGTGGATVGHGLGVAPSMVIVKPRSIADNWNVYHASNTSDPATDVLYLNLTNATSDNNTIWNDTAPTSTVFTIGSNSGINTNGGTYVAYCFAPVAGYSAFGSYTGNGSTDGPFVYTGFRPAFVLVKRTDSTGHWELRDTTRDDYNASTKRLFPNYSNAEDPGDGWDILSNGFKLRTTHSSINASGASQIYMAFAETPFSLSLAR